MGPDRGVSELSLKHFLRLFELDLSGSQLHIWNSGKQTVLETELVLGLRKIRWEPGRVEGGPGGQSTEWSQRLLLRL